MNSISNISKQTIENILKNKQELTPEQYSKEFCKLAKTVNLSIKECEYFEKILSKIGTDELENNNHESIYDLVDILIQRVPKKNLKNMSEMLQNSMKPSISLSIGDDLQSFCIQIGDSPSLIFEESIQQEMQRYIQNRFNVDQQVLSQKTADIARLVSLMNKYLGDAIESNNDGSSTVKNIKIEIESICPIKSSREDLGKLQSKLVEAAITIETEMSNVNKNLESGQNEVLVLEQKIRVLEKELKKTQAESKVDHLTSTLNRKSFEEELLKIENLYKREKEDYAIVFFDIDYFKKVNDTYGHDAGDIILKTFAALLLKLTRDTDTISRYGGEEFIAILRYKKTNELYKYIERIKNVVTKNKFIYTDNKIDIKFSAGVEIRSNCKTANDTVSKADKLLYKAKNTGRNKIIFWNNEER
jgi:diguanylate cyclase